MKKFFISIAGGLALGLLLSFSFMDYESSWAHHIQRAGVDQVVQEMDFDFVFIASLLVLGISALIFAVWSFIEKKKDEKFVRDFENDKNRDN
ncbi:hypothetical protein KQ939_00340 [Planococcus sp. CP5-4]|uniref:hypothetical protein n=2 Tax=Planococcus TaxID=1372 RepID=UPI001C24C4D2|nr:MULTISPECIES: hypothetical protein [unclassified Planococcus (in: firmicutes)]MBU9673315.1 hypothetical protein [Planococcus sp. CP5-4_YE]MBV0908088.1 hypothetical protein [Planococcus sp. CP5-4_UN]MBW6062149.1 hypothetical protein [Planococcus sp. CP5-4]